MAKWVHPDVLDSGLNEIINNANQMSLVTSFSPGDSYAIVTSRSVCDVAMAPTDFTLGNFGTNERQITVAAKAGTASGTSPVTPDLVIALLDTGTTRVLAVADEQSNQPITTGNPINFPVWNVRGRQPV